jgi:hypothetical protein
MEWRPVSISLRISESIERISQATSLAPVQPRGSGRFTYQAATDNTMFLTARPF